MKKSFSMMTWAFFILFFLFPSFARSQQGRQTACIQCHSGMDEKLAHPVEQWRASVHAKNGISCQGCHGGDPTLNDMEAMDPGKGYKGAPEPNEVPRFCGECHLGVMEDYLASAHGQALGAGGPQCVTCHGSHGIELASLKLINPESCTKCHGFERAAEIREALAETDGTIVTIDQQIKKLHRIGIAVENLQEGLFDTRNTFHRLFHSVDVEKVRSRTDEIQGRLKEIRQQVDGIEDRLDRRKTAGAVVVGLLLVMTALFLYVRHTYELEEKR
jgi:nitrate/TMAO reductase-like tetraheme cytochrome c subunit